MSEVTDQLREELREKYGEETCIVYRKKHGVFVFRKPSRVVWKKFQVAVQKTNDRQTCADQLCMDCLCYPEAEAGKPDFAKLTALFEDYPAISLDEAFEDLAKLAMGREDVSGKL